MDTEHLKPQGCSAHLYCDTVFQYLKLHLMFIVNGAGCLFSDSVADMKLE